jgi:hypothetical protein
MKGRSTASGGRRGSGRSRKPKQPSAGEALQVLAPAPPAERSEAFDTLWRDLLAFCAVVERTPIRRVATGGIGKKNLQRILPWLRRSEEEYASFLGAFLIDRRILFEGEDRWEASRPNLLRLWQPERLLRGVYHFWLRTPLWNESLQDPDVLSFVRREYVVQDPSLEARRRRLCEELATLPPQGEIEIGSLLGRLDRTFAVRGHRTNDPGFAPYGGRIAPGATLRRILAGPLRWLGLVEPTGAAGRPIEPTEADAFRVTRLGARVFRENWEEVARALGGALADPAARVTVQPNLEVLAPPDLDPAAYLTLARLADLRSVDVYTTFAITWDSLMNALDRGLSAQQILEFLEQISATEVPPTVRQLVRDCEGRHGEVQIGIAGPYIEAREKRLLEELEANPRFGAYLQRRIGEQVALLASNVDLGRLARELRQSGYSVRSAGADKLQITPHGAQLTVTRTELEALYAAVRAATRIAHDLDPDFDLSALASLEETLVLELSRQADSGAQNRARELEALVERLLRARGPAARAAAPPTEAKELEEIRSMLVAAVEKRMPLEIEYDGFQGVTRRVVEPQSFDGRYLTAFCRLRQDQRVFNSARILSARLLHE